MIILSGESEGNFPGGRMAGDQISSLAEGCFASPYYFACCGDLAGDVAQSKL